MPRTLLLCPEFPPSFWTRKNAYKFSGTRTLMPPLGLITVAALMPDEWEMRLVDLNCRRVTEDDWQWAELVAITGMGLQRQGFIDLGREAKRRGKTVIVGGPMVTSRPDIAREAKCDFLIKGEGENALPLWLEQFQAGAESGVFEHPEKADMKTSPIPRFDLLRFKDYICMSIQTCRGCPYQCEFCDITNLFGRIPRFKSPAQVLAELEYLYRLGWQKEVLVSDDNLIGNKAHARSLLKAMIPWMAERGEPFSFWAQTSIELGRYPDLIDLMTQANYSHVFIGIESPDEEVLSQTGKHQNVKNPMLESIRNITTNGLTVLPSFIIGFDGEKAGAGDRISSFVENAATPQVMLNLLQAPPNTDLWDRLEREGRLLKENTDGQSTGGNRLNYIPTRPEYDIITEYLQAWHRMFAPEVYLRRAFRYNVSIRPTRKALGMEEETQKAVGKKRPLIDTLRDIAGFLYICWWFGLREAKTRFLFWKQLIDMSRRNPTRLNRYLFDLFTGVELHQMEKILYQRAGYPHGRNGNRT